LLAIRRDQLKVLGRRQRSPFIEELAAMVCQDHPQARELSRVELRDRLHRSVDRALGYGIHLSEDVAAFVDLTFECGEDFEDGATYGWAREILDDSRRGGIDKIAAIEEKLDSDLDEAPLESDEAAELAFAALCEGS